MESLMEAKPLRAGDHWGRLQAIHDDLVLALRELDDLELHQAAAHVSTALDSLRRDRPQIAPSPGRAA